MPYVVRVTTVYTKRGKKLKKKAKAKSKTAAKRMVRLLGAIKAGYKPKRKSNKRRRRKNKS